MEESMDGLPGRVNATIPTNRWTVREQALDEVDFVTESRAAFQAIAMNAAVAFDIGVNVQGAFVDARTRTTNQPLVEIYSRMKHGDLDAVSFFAGQLAAAAMRSERFVSLCQKAVQLKRVIYMTTAAEFNVPSAANLLLKTTGAHLNIILTMRGMSPVVVAEQIRLSEGPLGYSSMAVRSRTDELTLGRGVTIVPESFRDQSVVFLDDLFSTGFTALRAERRLQNVNVAEMFFLFAARIDPLAVGSSHGQIEDRLNDACCDGSLQSTAQLLKRGNFAVVQKLLRVILNPVHTVQLAAYLQDIPTAAILKLYAASASGGFHQRRERRFLPSILVMEDVLRERGALDAERHIMEVARTP
jgi:hypothetical protein